MHVWAGPASSQNRRPELHKSELGLGICRTWTRAAESEPNVCVHQLVPTSPAPAYKRRIEAGLVSEHRYRTDIKLTVLKEDLETGFQNVTVNFIGERVYGITFLFRKNAAPLRQRRA
jgi:hypothetical protein